MPLEDGFGGVTLLQLGADQGDVSPKCNPGVSSYELRLAIRHFTSLNVLQWRHEAGNGIMRP